MDAVVFFLHFSVFLTVSLVSTTLNHLKQSLFKGEEFLPMILIFVVSCMSRELKCGAVLITEFTAAMTNDITEEIILTNQPTFTDNYIT